jgi:hypothetical protein
MMSGTCGLKEKSELSGAPTSDADLGDHRNTPNIPSEFYAEINQVFETLFGIAPPSNAIQKVQKNDWNVRSYSNDPKTPD